MLIIKLVRVGFIVAEHQILVINLKRNVLQLEETINNQMWGDTGLTSVGQPFPFVLLEILKMIRL